MRDAIFYEQRDWGLVEVHRMKVPDYKPTYSFAKPQNPTAYFSAGDIVPTAAIAEQEIFGQIGVLPTGELMYLKE